MAAGFPVKQNYAAGDILTAAQMNDLSSTLNYLDPTAKGDLFPASSGTALTRLAVGNNGETLVADSSTATGLRYTAGTVQSNPILNSAMQVWQRGTSFTGTSAGYGPDRWSCYRSVAGSTFSRQLTSDTTNVPNIQYCTRVQRNAGDTSTNDIYFYQSMETVNSIPFAGKTVTFSFYARKGANFSGGSSAITADLSSGTGTDQNLNGGITGNFLVATNAAVLTTTWQRFTCTGTVPTNSTQLVPNFRYGPSGTAGAADYFEITGVQIDIGSVALPFRTYAGTIQGELAACQRYYWRNTATQVYAAFFSGTGVNTTTVQGALQLPVTMRVSPSSVDYSTLGIGDNSAAATFTSLALVTSQSSTQQAWITVTGSGFTQYRTFFIYSGNSTSGYIGVSAEL